MMPTQALTTYRGEPISFSEWRAFHQTVFTQASMDECGLQVLVLRIAEHLENTLPAWRLNPAAGLVKTVTAKTHSSDGDKVGDAGLILPELEAEFERELSFKPFFGADSTGLYPSAPAPKAVKETPAAVFATQQSFSGPERSTGLFDSAYMDTTKFADDDIKSVLQERGLLDAFQGVGDSY